MSAGPQGAAGPVEPGQLEPGQLEPGQGPGLLRRLLTPRLRRVDLAVAVLLAVLGFAAVVQVRSTQEDGPLATARQEDLVQILDELANRNDRLRAEVSALERTRRDLTSGNGTNEAALTEARRRSQLLGVLAGTVPARGPGLRITITDPKGQVTAAVLLGALEELRAAGAEAVQLEGPATLGEPAAPPVRATTVRVVASTAFVDGDGGVGGGGGVNVDGALLRAPYRFTVIGDPDTIETALGIPGGVLDSVEQSGGRVVVVQGEDVLVGALRATTTPRYARPAS